MANEDRYAIVAKAIRACGERVTSARVQVLVAMEEAGQPLTQAEVYERLAGELHTDPVTVYRVLDWGVKKGLVDRITGPERVWRFSRTRSGFYSGGYFRCMTCGSVSQLARALESTDLALPAGAVARSVNVEVSGTCAACLGRGAGDGAPRMGEGAQRDAASNQDLDPPTGFARAA